MTNSKKKKISENFLKEDYAKWKVFRNSASNTITNDEYNLLCDLHAYYFQHKSYHPSKCCGQKTLNKWIADLNLLYLEGL